MRKHLAILCAAVLCASCLVLAACTSGGSSGSAASASGSGSATAASASASAASASSSAAAADPTAKFIGTWTLAALEANGVTISGGFENVLGGKTFGMTLTNDTKGTFSFGEDTIDVNWQAKDANTLTLTGGEATMEAAYKDGAISIAMNNDGFSGTIILTKDGTYSAAKKIESNLLRPITSKDALVGSWALCGLNISGTSMYADASALATLANLDVSETTLTFTADGKLTGLGLEEQYTIGANGAALTSGGVEFPIFALDNDLAIDMSGLAQTTFIMVFQKQ